MKVGDKIEFYLFGAKESGIVVVKNKDKTINIDMGGIIYPNVKTFSALPKKKGDIPPWYILK
jgi:hypothetical protein